MLQCNKTWLVFDDDTHMQWFLIRHMAKTAAKEKTALEDGIKIATEATANIRTVASLRKF